MFLQEHGAEGVQYIEDEGPYEDEEEFLDAEDDNTEDDGITVTIPDLTLSPPPTFHTPTHSPHTQQPQSESVDVSEAGGEKSVEVESVGGSEAVTDVELHSKVGSHQEAAPAESDQQQHQGEQVEVEADHQVADAQQVAAPTDSVDTITTNTPPSETIESSSEVITESEHSQNKSQTASSSDADHQAESAHQEAPQDKVSEDSAAGD